MTKALLIGDFKGAHNAYEAWLAASGTEVATATFPTSDAEALITIGRPRLAKLLVTYGLLSFDPSVTEPLFLD